MKFGDVGIEETQDGLQRKVMWVAPEQVVILYSEVPEDDEQEFTVGCLTYAIRDTKWGVKSDIDLAETLGIASKTAETPPKLLK